MLTALRLFLSEEPEARRAAWLTQLEMIAAGLGSLHNVSTRLVDTGEVPLLELVVEPNAKLNAFRLVEELLRNTPPIHVDCSLIADGILLCNPMCLKQGEPEMIARGLRDLLGH